MRIQFEKLGDFVGGFDGGGAPHVSVKIREAHEYVSQFSARLKSLEWISTKRPEWLGGALVTFAARRDEAAASDPTLLPDTAFGILRLLPSVDHVRLSVGGTWSPHPRRESWADELNTSVDEVVEVLWLLRVGLTVPAAVMTRTHLERWTYNIAHHLRLVRDVGETDLAYISRVWHVAEAPENVGAWWAWLSEIIHGRAGTDAFGPDAAATITLRLEDLLPLHDAIAQVAGLVFLRVRSGIFLLAKNHGLDEMLDVLNAPASTARIPEPLPLGELHFPLDFFETNRNRSDRLAQWAAGYRADVLDESRDLSHMFDLQLSMMAMLERRGRAVEAARAAFASERDQLRDEFDPVRLTARVFRSRTTSEAARILAAQVEGVERTALLTAAQVAGGSLHLWLQDSNHALGCVRVILEQVARLRAHRLKPQRAMRLEQTKNASAARWLSEAGWGRLAVFFRAMNEYVHAGARSRRSGASKLLRAMAHDPQAPATSRGSAVSAAEMLLAFEVRDRLHEISPDLAHSFSATVTLASQEDHLRSIESFLTMVHGMRAHDFGAPDLADAW